MKDNAKTQQTQKDPSNNDVSVWYNYHPTGLHDGVLSMTLCSSRRQIGRRWVCILVSAKTQEFFKCDGDNSLFLTF